MKNWMMFAILFLLICAYGALIVYANMLREKSIEHAKEELLK